MPVLDNPDLSLAISRLEMAQSNHYALWILKAPYPGGYVHRDCAWPETLTQLWQNWQTIFSQDVPSVPRFISTSTPNPVAAVTYDPAQSDAAHIPYTVRLMQQLGVSLWRWVFDGPIKSSLDQSQGISMGQGKPLRLRLDIRDPDLTNLPWEIMQAEAGKPAISLSQQILFSRTTSAVDPLPVLRPEQALKVLLVLGQASDGRTETDGSVSASLPSDRLNLQQEADTLKKALEYRSSPRYHGFVSSVESSVETLVQPTPAELTNKLETEQYNVFFYAGHGVPAPDGGLLFLRPGSVLNGTELAQVLTRCQVKLAVFNACWGAQPDRDSNQQLIPRSSLAEVLIHHGVPAVLAMRDSIADQEALSFIATFAQALVDRTTIDQAVAIARQQLLTLYKFNQPTWTLPVLYMHPEFSGELIKPVEDGVTEIPEQSPTWIGRKVPHAFLRPLGTSAQIWPIQGGIMRVGAMEGNDLIIQGPGISREHAEIFYRDSVLAESSQSSFYLRDFSRYGTLVLGSEGWQRVHKQEVPLQSRTQLKFGSHRSQALEFIVENSS